METPMPDVVGFSESCAPGPTFGLRETVLHSVLSQCAANPAKPCLIFHGRDQTVSYGAFEDACLRIAGLLSASGVRRRDIVMIFLPTHRDAYAGFFAAMMLGAIPTYMPSPSPKQEPGKYWRDHAALLARTQPRAILTDDDTAAAMRASGLPDAAAVALLTIAAATDPLPITGIAAAHPDDTALLQHSSGTTGLKKGVMLSHAAVVTQVAAYAAAITATSQDVIATWLPVYHDMGLIACTLLPLMLGQTIVVLDPFAWAAKPGLLLEAIDRHRATLVWQPNFAFEHLVRTTRADELSMDLSSVRAFVNCSEPCRPATFDRFAAHFAGIGISPRQLQASYAMAETVFAVTQTPLGRTPARLTVSARALREERRARSARPGEETVTLLSNGPPIAGMTASALRADGAICAEGEVGELVVRGDSLFSGYFRLPEQTTERLSASGLRTRDMGFVVGGEVYVLGRMDDMIIVHGRNYYAGEVEHAVNRVVGVKPGRAVAFSQFNAEAGSDDVVVVAELAAELDAPGAAALSKRIKRMILQEVGLAVHEVRVVRSGWLRKTTSGKISRDQNRAAFIAEKAASIAATG